MIITRTPLRISLVGGGTDFHYYFEEHGGAVVSMTINKYIYVSLCDVSDFHPNRYRITSSVEETVSEIRNISNPLIRAAYDIYEVKPGTDLSIQADVPAGTGLGSSSAFAAGLLKAISPNQDKFLDNVIDLEIEYTEAPIGIQDHCSATIGGFNLYRFSYGVEVEAEPINISSRSISSNLMLFYLGGRRFASDILRGVKDRIQTRTEILHEMKKQAFDIVSPLEKGDWQKVGDIVNQGWALKKQLGPGISNPNVETAINAGLQAGAYGGKLLGAGGTGFILFVAPPKYHESISRAMGLKQITFGLDTKGCTVIYEA